MVDATGHSAALVATKVAKHVTNSVAAALVRDVAFYVFYIFVSMTWHKLAIQHRR